MKAKLIKTEVNYLLENKEGVIIASTSLNKEGKSLSKQNCDEIFGILNVDWLAWQYGVTFGHHPEMFLMGFKKAMELNKDKLFTLEDMHRAIELAREFKFDRDEMDYTTVNFTETNIIQSLQQPTEIDVEVEMYDFELPGKPIGRRIIKPKVDSEGCLILKRVV